MILAWGGIVPPECWEHSPNIVDRDGCSVAIYLAKKGKEPGKVWLHDTERIKDKKDNTVAMLLA